MLRTKEVFPGLLLNSLLDTWVRVRICLIWLKFNGFVHKKVINVGFNCQDGADYAKFC